MFLQYFKQGWRKLLRHKTINALQITGLSIELQWWMFVAAGVIALLLAFLTLSLQSIKATQANPVQSLRSE